MLLFLAMLLTFTGMAILVSMYSSFLPFSNEFKNILDYNVAYYGALGSIERSQLVLRYKQAGFEGSGGWIDDVGYGKNSDIIVSNFNMFKGQNDSMMWNIKSKTTRIPQLGEGNVDKLLSASDSKNYNKLSYNRNEIFIMSVDNSSSNDYYNTAGIIRTNYTSTYITGILRLPPQIKIGLNNANLCDTCDIDGDGIVNDIMVDRSIKGFFNSDSFSIIPNISTLRFGSVQSVDDDDNAIRENIINAGGSIGFQDGFNIGGLNPGYLTKHNVISNSANTLSSIPFKDIFNDSNVSGLELNLSLVNRLQTVNGNVYPFLEYYLDFGTTVSDRFFTIDANGRKGEYDVKIIVKKPTNKENSIGTFTVVF